MILIPSSQRHFFDWSKIIPKIEKKNSRNDICIQTDGRREGVDMGLTAKMLI